MLQVFSYCWTEQQPLFSTAYFNYLVWRSPSCTNKVGFVDAVSAIAGSESQSHSIGRVSGDRLDHDPRARLYSVAAYSVLYRVRYCVQKGNMLIRWLISCSSSITAIVLVCSVRSGINHMVKNYLFCQSWPTKPCSLEP